jgi:hypothetical protein
MSKIAQNFDVVNALLAAEDARQREYLDDPGKEAPHAVGVVADGADFAMDPDHEESSGDVTHEGRGCGLGQETERRFSGHFQPPKKALGPSARRQVFLSLCSQLTDMYVVTLPTRGI